MNAAARPGDQSAMSVNDLEQRLSDLECRHERTRGLLVDALAVAVILLIGFMFRPEGWSAAMLGFGGALFAPRLIASLFLRDRARPRPRPPVPVAPWREADRHGIGSRRAAG
jgi:hypothetical protein